jgi:cold shock CspA family protein
MSGPRHGRVASFDEPRGLGEVEDTEGVRHGFHCSAIADGSRTIDVDTAVTYRVVSGRSGRWEAADLVPEARSDA